jgi:hypothetical protein
MGAYAGRMIGHRLWRRAQQPQSVHNIDAAKEMRLRADGQRARAQQQLAMAKKISAGTGKATS